MSQISKKAIAANLISQHAYFFRCPICASDMSFGHDQSLRCLKGHSFDLAKKGYVHLLSQSVHTKYDKELFYSRKQVADSGFFTPLVERIGDLIQNESNAFAQPIAIFDAGCGEGSLLSQIQTYIQRETIGVGADISKEGIQLATDNISDTIWFVADLANCPLENGKFDSIINILSPSNYAEFDRLLTEDGLLIKVIPNHQYLQELRGIFFGDEEDYKNRNTEERFRENFHLIQSEIVQYKIRLKQPLLNHLVKMTPLSWSASENQLKQVSDLSELDVTVDLTILVGQKR